MPDENNDLVDKPDVPIEVLAAADQISDHADLNDTLKVEHRSKFSRFINFVKNHKITLSIVTLVLAILIALYIFIPVISVGKTQLVNVNTIFKLEEGQTAKLKIRNVSVKIVHLTNDVCPVGNRCFGTGKKAVEYMLTENGKGFANGSETPATGSEYKIETVSSDYKTYAEIKIVKAK